MEMNIVGAGRVGKVLGKELYSHGLVEISGILNRTEESSRVAATKIGSGKAVKNAGDLSKADIWMFTVSDDALPVVIEGFQGTDFSNSLVFHCSGALSSKVFNSLNARGTASLHPVMTFADSSFESLSGAFFTIEGNQFAVEVLSKLVTQIGGVLVEIPADRKLLYHSAMVIVSNYLTSIIYAGQQLLVESGFSQDQALKLIGPLASEALKNNLSLGPIKSLTGPIQRGDSQIVSSEIEVLAENRFLDLYTVLGKVALEISLKAGLKPEASMQLSKVLSSGS